MDKDIDYNNKLIKYEFLYSNSSTGQHFESFSIDNKTGVITLTGNLDREEKSSFRVFHLIIKVNCSNKNHKRIITVLFVLNTSIINLNEKDYICYGQLSAPFHFDNFFDSIV